ncbi:MAG: HAMP domain-containing histidine kinase [Bacteroidales bacterium]|nr:HAMP domain-containing histidine kinase [Bacteroidales bacterium]
MNINLEKFIGNKQDYSLRHRVLIISILAAILLKILSLLIDELLNVQWQASAFSAFALFYFTLFYFIAYHSKNYDRVIIFLVSGVFVLLAPISWFVNEGSAGSTIYDIFVAVVATYTLSEGKMRIKLLFLSGISILIIIALEYYYPEYIIAYSSNQGRLLDNGIHAIISVLALTFYLNVYYDEYKRTVKKLTISNQHLSLSQEESKKQQKKIQEQNIELIKKAGDLEKTIKTKDRFYTIIAHDLKSPFNSIIGFSDLVEDAIKLNDFEKIKSYSKYITDSSEQAYKLLLNLLDWSRIQTMDIEYRPTEVDLKKLIEEQINIYKYMAVTKNNIFETNLENCYVFADKNMLETIIRNLISNAIKYTENGKIIIKSCYNQDACLIKIKDTGLGIDNNMLKNIFQTPVSMPGTKGEKGSGLGLRLCKEFVETNKGRLDVLSQPGKGSTFSFTLPISVKEKQNVS